jgi:hypothetical protein
VSGKILMVLMMLKIAIIAYLINTMIPNESNTIFINCKVDLCRLFVDEKLASCEKSCQVSKYFKKGWYFAKK